ncbi:MAG: CPBP family intramembrane metalloprotease, partial [Lachnospiraceae bacterium]|nr:CPBP family intramembrane metalloprotease [Lachnospiraceae bacterium]
CNGSCCSFWLFRNFWKAFGCIGLGAALAEELLFRGMVLKLVEIKFGTKCALLFPAVFWAFLHLFTADFSQGVSALLRVISVTYVGFVFSVITVVTGSIWNSVFFHAMWNFITSGVIFVGNKANDHVMFNYVPAEGNALLTGGENGLDGSVITMVCYTVVMILAAFPWRIYSSRKDAMVS